MENEVPMTDYAAMLADLEAKKAALEGAIIGLRAAIASGALGFVGGNAIQFKDALNVKLSPAPTIQPGGVALPRGAFLGKTAPEAIKLYLTAIRRKQTNKEIAQALKDGGLESAGNFDNYVTNGLFRLKQELVVLRFDDGWGLAEWYPESFRTRVTEKAAVTTKKKKKKTTRKASSKRIATPTAQQTVEPKPSPPKPQALIEEHFAVHAGEDFSAEQIAVALNIRVQTVSLICAKLAHAGKIEKTADGRFRLSRVQQMPKAS